MIYTAKNYEHLLGAPGFSDNALKTHFTLYEGYVKNVNLMIQALEEMTKAGKIGTPAHSEVQRRLGWEWNGMRLHEIYFGSMTKEKTSISKEGALARGITRIYGTHENWEKDFRAVGMMRGMGWVALYHDPESGEIFNVWINEHDVGHLAGCQLLLAMDVLEHAYIMDYGIKRADYIDAFMKVINWDVVEKRFTK